MSTNYDAMTIAKWFIAWAGEDEADLSNLKLQKLLYYAQGWHLARKDRPLFADAIQAWSHGPVVPAVYHAFKQYGTSDIRLSVADSFRWGEVDRKTTEFLVEVWNTYGEFGAWRLRNMTHSERPWKSNFQADERHIEIPVDELKTYFKSRQKRA